MMMAANLRPAANLCREAVQLKYMWLCILEILETVCDEKHMASQVFL